MFKAWAELAVYRNLLCVILVFSIVVPTQTVSGPFTIHYIGCSWPYFDLVKTAPQNRKLWWDVFLVVMETMTSFIFHLHFNIFLENNTAPMSLLINEPKHCSQRWFICRITFQDSNWCWYHIYYGLTDGIIKRWDIIWPRAVKHSQSRQYVSNNCGKTLSCNVGAWLTPRDCK